MTPEQLSPEDAERYQELEDEKVESIVSIRQILLSVTEVPHRTGNLGNITEAWQNPGTPLQDLIQVLLANFESADWDRLASLNPSDGKKCGEYFHSYILARDRQRRLLGKPIEPWWQEESETTTRRR